MDGCVVYHQVSREESRPSAAAVASSSSPPAPSTTNTSRRLLEEVLQRPAPYPMIVLPPGGGYWLDGQDHDCPFDPRGQPILPHNAWRSKIETDDTAKCYRRFFVGRVSCLRPLSPQLAHKLSPSVLVTSFGGHVVKRGSLTVNSRRSRLESWSGPLSAAFQSPSTQMWIH
uniref:Uncharacterized protein n=1 Tax=Timema bartmani TaxID=61472 RepID=A0A7R9F0C7_9NEOP|nr:unnamed protein product [Timema bartmani]